MLIRNKQNVSKNLNEAELTALGLNFLRRHYNNYLHQLKILIEPEQKKYRNIVIDGSLTIPMADGKKYFATVEASSIQKKDEVTYLILRRRRWMDAFAFGTTLTFFWLLIDHIFDFYFHHLTTSFWPKLGIAFALISILMFLFYIIFHKRLRYYYVYAVEQFKRYYADDQWIVISGALWSYLDFDDRDILKRQCIKYGIGLIKAEENGHVEMLIDAAKYDILQGTRSSKIKKNLVKWQAPIRDQNKKLSYQYIPSDFRTFLAGALGLTAIVLLVLFESFESSKEIYADEAGYENYLKKRAYGPEADFFYLDAAYLPYQNFQLPKYHEALSDIPKNLFVSSNKKLYMYDCHRIDMNEAPYYIIQIDWFDTKTKLLKQMVRLQNKTVVLNGLWMGCYYDQADYYVLFTGPFFTSKSLAVQKMEEARIALLRNGVSFKKLKIIEVAK